MADSCSGSIGLSVATLKLASGKNVAVQKDISISDGPIVNLEIFLIALRRNLADY
jgi:hypothetical protein